MAASVTTDVAVVELRQYTLVPGRRDDMIAIFERHFIESQEEAGMRLLGHFRDLGDPNRFVWLRGFRDMPSRRAALESFYGSELWFEHRDAVNETIVDSDDVLLLRPAAECEWSSGARPENGGGRLAATIWPFVEPVSPDTIALLADKVAEAGATTVALLDTEPSENDFPRLPVREGENVVVWVGRLGDETALDSTRWSDRLAGPPRTLRLASCARSALT